MSNELSPRKQRLNSLKTISISVLVCFFASIVFMVLFALLLSKFQIPNFLIKAFVIIIAIIAGLASGFISGKSIRQKGIIIGLLSGVIMLVLMFVLSLFFNNSSNTFIFSIIKDILVLISSVAGGILGTNYKQNHFKY